MPIQTTDLQSLKDEIKKAFDNQKKEILKVKKSDEFDENAVTKTLADEIAIAIDNHIKRMIVTINSGIPLTGAGSATPAGAVTITGTTTGVGTS